MTGNNKVRSDVLDEALDERMAPSLGGVVLGREHEMYVDAEQFFQRTLFTEQMVSILGNIVSVLKGEGGKKILVLNALYGGGKTHTLLTIYHALKTPHAMLKATFENEELRRRVSRFIEDLARVGKPDLVVVDGYFSELAPSPISPLDARTYRVRTLWGYIAHALGSYSIVKDFDERQVAPDADRLLELFKNRSVVILLDELAHYIKRFHETPDESLQRYSHAIESFMEALAISLELSRNAVLVISLPAVEKAQQVVVETTYHSVRQTVENIFKALKRVSSEYIEPIAPQNIPALLRTRLFEEIDVKRARDVHEAIRRIYEENREIFGVQAPAIGELLKTYPFHPLYISTLLDILEKHEGLQKTRDLLRISRKVLREVLNDKRAFDLIMPWHIDVTKDTIRNTLLIGEYEGFKPIVEEDINERSKLFGEKRDLVRIAALALLAKTFVYGGGIIIPKIDVLPHEKELAQMIYEPALFQQAQWSPKDIVDAVNWMSDNLIYVVKDEKTGRLWFTKWVTPIKYVEERARKIEDLPALNRVLEYANRLLREPASSLMEERPAKTKPARPRVFDVELSQACRTCEPLNVDARKYVLLACLEVPEDKEERRAKFEEIMYKTKSGGARSYANTIYIAFPSVRRRIDYALEFARKLVACEEVEREGIIDKLVGALSAKEAEIAKEIYKRKLEDYKKGVLRNLMQNVIYIFDKIAYPDYDEERLANTVREVDFFVTQMDSIIIAAEKSLASMGIGKIKTEMDFDILDFYLKRLNIDISEGDKTFTVKEITDFFYSNPRLPAVQREVILDAIKDGVRKLRIGLKSKQRIYFKRLYEKEPPEVSEGESVPTVDEDDEILPWRIALEEQLKSLKRREIVEGKERKVEEYIVRIDGREIATEEIAQNLTKFDLEVLRVSPIIRVVKAATMKIEVKQPLIEVSPSEPISIEAWVVRVGPYTGEVILKPSVGRVNVESIMVSDKFTRERVVWDVGNAPEEPGDYTYTLEVVDSSGSTLDVVKITVRVLGERVGWSEGLPPAGSKLEGLEILADNVQSIKPLNILRKRIGGSAFISKGNFKVSIEREDVGKSSIELRIENLQIDDLIDLSLMILNRFQLLNATISLDIYLKPHRKEYFIIPQFTEEESKALGEYRIRYIVWQTRQ